MNVSISDYSMTATHVRNSELPKNTTYSWEFTRVGRLLKADEYFPNNERLYLTGTVRGGEELL